MSSSDHVFPSSSTAAVPALPDLEPLSLGQNSTVTAKESQADTLVSRLVTTNSYPLEDTYPTFSQSPVQQQQPYYSPVHSPKYTVLQGDDYPRSPQGLPTLSATFISSPRGSLNPNQFERQPLPSLLPPAGMNRLLLVKSHVS